ncbi:MAG: hypothetical protein ABSG57_11220 [Candidatus Bathyarchaeia archaeon]
MTMTIGENSASISMKLAIANVVKRYSGTTNQSNGFWLMEQTLLGTLTREFWISEFEKDYPNHGKEIYDEMVQWYSKTNIQQHKENAIETEAKKIRKEARDKIREIRNQFLQAETVRMNDKHEAKEAKEEEMNAPSPKQRQALEKAERDLAQVENFVPSAEQLANPEWVKGHGKLVADRRAVVDQLKAQQTKT